MLEQMKRVSMPKEERCHQSLLRARIATLDARFRVVMCLSSHVPCYILLTVVPIYAYTVGDLRQCHDSCHFKISLVHVHTDLPSDMSNNIAHGAPGQSFSMMLAQHLCVSQIVSLGPGGLAPNLTNKLQMSTWEF
eukprot:6153378-Amphidinium_carterae.1